MAATKKFARTAAAAFVFLWVAIVFGGAEIKLHDAPPSQDGCFIKHIAQQLNLDVTPDCSAGDSLVGAIAAAFVLEEVSDAGPILAGVDKPTIKDYITAANFAVASGTLTPSKQEELTKAIAVVNSNDDLFRWVNEIQRNDYTASTTLGLGEDRYIGPWRTGKYAFGGKTYECSETLFANDIGDYFDFLMGNVCTGAIEMRCIFSRITHVLMSLSAFAIMIVAWMHDREHDREPTKKPGCISTSIAILGLLVILILPMITAVQTTKSVTKSFAAPGTNKRLGSAYEFGLLAPLIDPVLANFADVSAVSSPNGGTVVGSLLRLGTIPHDTQGECGLGWSESVVALVENLASPVTIGAASTVDSSNFLTTLLSILDMLKYTVEYTAVWYLRLVTIPVVLVFVLCSVGNNEIFPYHFVSSTANFKL